MQFVKLTGTPEHLAKFQKSFIVSKQFDDPPNLIEVLLLSDPTQSKKNDLSWIVEYTVYRKPTLLPWTDPKVEGFLIDTEMSIKENEKDIWRINFYLLNTFSVEKLHLKNYLPSKNSFSNWGFELNWTKISLQEIERVVEKWKKDNKLNGEFKCNCDNGEQTINEDK